MVYAHHDTLYVISTERDSALYMLLEEVRHQGDVLGIVALALSVASACVVLIAGLVLWEHIGGRIRAWWRW